MEKYFKEWFEKRGLIYYPYQHEILNKVYPLLSNNEIAVVAASPSAGKTYMSIAMIDYYLSMFPNAKVLVLAHGTKVLRTQFYDSVEEIKPDFTYSKIEKGREFMSVVRHTNSQVIITLPQSIDRLTKISQFDLLIVDEAHEFYFAQKKGKNGAKLPGMIEKIIAKIKPKCQLLLTGTPSKFIMREFPNIIPVTIQKLLKENQICDPIIELAKSSHNFKHNKDYNVLGELYNTRKFSEEKIDIDLDSVFEQIYKRLKQVGGKSPKYLHNDVTIVSNVTKLLALNKLDKTMIVCKSQKQAKCAEKYFINKGIKVKLSISDTDVDSTMIQEFKDEHDAMILIVVGRGILGFNYTDLVNVVDMTFSINIDRIFQLLSRIIRKKKGVDKLYIKLVPENDVSYYDAVLMCVMALTTEEWFLKYNGKNFLEIPVPATKPVKVKPPSEDTVKKKKKSDPMTKYKSPDYLGLPIFKWFNYVSNKKGKVYDTFSWTRFSIVRDSLNGLKTYKWDTYSDDEIIDIAVNWIKEENITETADVWKSWLSHILEYRKIKERVFELSGLESKVSDFSDYTKQDFIDTSVKYIINNKTFSRTTFKESNISLFKALESRKYLNEVYSMVNDKLGKVVFKEGQKSWKNISNEQIIKQALKKVKDENIINRNDVSKKLKSLYGVMYHRKILDVFWKKSGLVETLTWKDMSDKELFKYSKKSIKENNLNGRYAFKKAESGVVYQLKIRGLLEKFFEDVKWIKPSTPWVDMQDEELITYAENIIKDNNFTRRDFQHKMGGPAHQLRKRGLLEKVFEKLKLDKKGKTPEAN